MTSPYSEALADLTSVAAELVRTGREADRVRGVTIKDAVDTIRQTFCLHARVEDRLSMAGLIPHCRDCGKPNPREDGTP